MKNKTWDARGRDYTSYIIRKTWSPQITKFWTWKKRIETRTQECFDRARWFHELDSEFSDEDKRNIGNNVFTKMSFSVTEVENNSHTLFQRVYKSISSFTNGITTQAPLIAQKRRSGRKRSPQSQRRKQLLQLCKVDYQKNEERLRSEILIVLAQFARQDDRWQDSTRDEMWPEVWRTINLFFATLIQ